jgi:galactarate dehydratase
MHERDNVAIVANDGGLPAGTRFAAASTLVDGCRKATRWRCATSPRASAVRRYNVTIGRAARAIPPAAGCTSACSRCPTPLARGLPIATVQAPPLPPLEGHTFEGYRNADGSVGTRNILAITTTVQCVAGVVDFACSASSASCCPSTRTSTTWSAGAHLRLAASPSTRPTPSSHPHLRNISLNPNFGGEVMVVSLGCESCSPNACCRRARSRSSTERNVADIGATEEPKLDVVCLQDEAHVGFMSMIDSVNGHRRGNTSNASTHDSAETCRPASWWWACNAAAATPFSGVTANPAVGFCTDLLVRAGATVMFSETTRCATASTSSPRAPQTPRWPTR